MRRALTLVGVGVVVAIAGVSLIYPPAAVIALGVAIACVGLILTQIKGPEA
jgi:hypothetical protein